MAEFPARTGILDAARLAAGPHAAAHMQAVPPAAQFIFRGGEAACSLASQAFGGTIPLQSCRALQNGERTALWLGPDEWLLLAPADQAHALQAAMAAALADMPHAFVDVSHRNTALHISGSEAAAVLNAGCPLDLHAASFPVNMCTRTILAKAPVILWRAAPQLFYVGTWRSFMPYVWDFLVEARTRL